jgi:hypothetical protein
VVIAVRPNGNDAQPYSSAHGLAGNPNGFDIRLRGPLRRSPAGYSHVERMRKRWRAGPPLGRVLIKRAATAECPLLGANRKTFARSELYW